MYRIKQPSDRAINAINALPFVLHSECCRGLLVIYTNEEKPESFGEITKTVSDNY